MMPGPASCTRRSCLVLTNLEPTDRGSLIPLPKWGNAQTLEGSHWDATAAELPGKRSETAIDLHQSPCRRRCLVLPARQFTDPAFNCMIGR
jgi:hypothetical protein